MGFCFYYVLEGREPREVSHEEWAEWMKSPFEERARVAETTVGDLWVSTVFLAMNHNFGDGEPILFETKIKRGDRVSPNGEGRAGVWLDFQRRYATFEEALAGHEEAVEQVRSGGIA